MKRRRDSKRNGKQYQRHQKECKRVPEKEVSASRDSREESRSDKMSSLNDLSWYTRYPELSAAAGMFSYPYRPGMTVKDGYLDVSTADVQLNYRIPGYMVLDWAPCIGRSESATDPASVVAREIYSRVRKEFSGSLEADAPDFLVYLVCLDSVFSYIGALKRIYRIIHAYSPDNRTLPNELLYALGLSEEWQMQLTNDKTKFWGVINQLVHMSRKLSCPIVMDYFKRHYWLNDNVYTDDASINSQMYVFRQAYYYQYTEIDTPEGVPAAGATLIPTIITNASTSNQAIDQMFNFGRQLIDNLSAWDDAYTINGYLQRAYGDVPQFMVDILLQDETFTPVYVPEVLTQIENSMAIYQGAYDKINANVAQDPKTNAVLSTPTIVYGTANAAALAYLPAKVLFNARTAVPTAADNIIMSRLHGYLEASTEGDAGTVFNIIAGTEIPICWYLIRKLEASGTLGQVPIKQKLTISGGSTGSSLAPTIFSWLEIEQFDWHPCIMVCITGATGQKTQIGWDVHNLTVIDPDSLKELHKVCTYSEFNAFM